MALNEQRRNVTKNLIENRCLLLGQKRCSPILVSFDMSLIRNSYQLKLNETTEIFLCSVFYSIATVYHSSLDNFWDYLQLVIS